MGCTLAQGFHFAPALPPASFESMLSAAEPGAAAFVRRVAPAPTS
jgi:hypothetical protein